MAKPGELPTPQPGQFCKVFLPGESPWAKCVAVHDDDTWTGTINNHLVSDLHDYDLGMTVRFKREIAPEWEIWVPAEQPHGSA